MAKEHPAVGWANDAIHELQMFVEKAKKGEFDDTHLDQAEEQISSARDEMPEED